MRIPPRRVVGCSASAKCRCTRPILSFAVRRLCRKTRHAQPPVAWVSPALYQRLGLVAGDFLRVRQAGGEALVPVGVDERLPDECIRLAAARPETATLGAMFGPVTAERVVGEQKVAV